MPAIKIIAERYHDDTRTSHEVIAIDDWFQGGLKTWIVEHMNPRGGSFRLPEPGDGEHDKSFELGWLPGGWCWEIHEIIFVDDGRILYSDGRNTSGKKHVSWQIAEIVRQVQDEIENPPFV